MSQMKEQQDEVVRFATHSAERGDCARACGTGRFCGAGVERWKSKKLVSLAAASGSAVWLSGDAKLEFVRRDRKCSLKFLDADVNRPLASVSAIVDEGHRVVFLDRRSRTSYSMCQNRWTRRLDGRPPKSVTFGRPAGGGGWREGDPWTLSDPNEV